MKHRAVTIILCFAPLLALANPYILDPGSLIAFGVVLFWAMVVESGIVALLLAWKGMNILPVFVSYFLCNAAVYFLLFRPLQNRGWTIFSLESLVVCVDALVIKLFALIPGLQRDSYNGVKAWQALLFSAIGNSSSYFIGFITERKPWEL